MMEAWEAGQGEGCHTVDCGFHSMCDREAPRVLERTSDLCFSRDNLCSVVWIKVESIAIRETNFEVEREINRSFFPAIYENILQAHHCIKSLEEKDQILFALRVKINHCCSNEIKLKNCSS